MPSWTTSQVIIACIATFSAGMVAGAITLLHLSGVLLLGARKTCRKSDERA